MTVERTYPRWAITIAVLMAAATIAVIGALAAYALPMGDDFRHLGTDDKAFSEMIRRYDTIGGRWATHFVHASVVGRIDLLRYYALALAAMLAARVLAISLAVRAVLQRSAAPGFHWWIGASFAVLYWGSLPAPGDSLFWINGAFELELAGTFLLVVLAVLFGGPMTAARACGAALLIVPLTGVHELAALAVSAGVAAACGFAFYQRRQDRWLWAGLVLLSLTGTVVALIAPGNFARATYQGSTAPPVRGAVLTAASIAAWLPRWLFDAPLLLMALLALLDPRLRIRCGRTSLAARYTFLGAWTSILVVCFLLPVVAGNGILAGRVLTWLYFIFIAGFFVNLLLWKEHLPIDGAQAILRPEMCGRLRTIALPAAFAAVFFAGNPWLGALDLALRVPSWHRARRQALDTMEQAAPGSVATLPQLPVTPHSYFDFDASNPPDYPNDAMARYFGLARVDSPNPPVRPRGAAPSGRTYGILQRR